MGRLVCLAVSCAILMACQSDDQTPDTGRTGSGATVEPIRVLDPDEDYEGKSLEAWAIEYMRWSNSAADCSNAVNDDDGSRCGLDQEADSPVFFFERSTHSRSDPPRAERTRCDVPAGKAILVPVSVVYIDNAGSPVEESADELREQALRIKESMRNMQLRIDGEEIADLDARGVGPAEFEYDVPPTPNIFSCDGFEGVSDTTVRPSFVAGFLAILAPPPPGEHEVEYRGTFTYAGVPFATHVRNTFTIEASTD